jgi:o-succinylbenzoate synthase
MTHSYRFEFRPYSRPFKQPLQTSHGWWSCREGIIVRLVSAEGRVGWGEIAPVEAFGSESIEQALAFCQSLPIEITATKITQIPRHLFACRFGFEAAEELLTCSDFDRPPLPPLECSALLPSGAAALQAWQEHWQAGKRTLKWKIGVADLQQELLIFEQLMAALPIGAKLRLDANGGLNWQEASEWLQKCDRHAVEFLEQPLPPNQFEQMLALSQRYATPIALDESVATTDQLGACYQQGWRGIVVIKPAIAGSLRRLRQFCQEYKIDVVWSSVFETTIARRFITDRLVPSLPHSSRAIGFGTDHWFADALSTQPDFVQLWQSL